MGTAMSYHPPIHAEDHNQPIHSKEEEDWYSMLDDRLNTN